MGKIDRRAEKGFQFFPTREGDIVVGGDTSHNNVLQHLRKRGTDSAALSVWQPAHPSILDLSIHDHEQHPGGLPGYDEIHLQIPDTIERRPLIDILPAVLGRIVLIPFLSSLSLVPAPEEIAVIATATGELVYRLGGAGYAEFRLQVSAHLLGRPPFPELLIDKAMQETVHRHLEALSLASPAFEI